MSASIKAIFASLTSSLKITTSKNLAPIAVAAVAPSLIIENVPLAPLFGKPPPKEVSSSNQRYYYHLFQF